MVRRHEEAQEAEGGHVVAGEEQPEAQEGEEEEPEIIPEGKTPFFIDGSVVCARNMVINET